MTLSREFKVGLFIGCTAIIIAVALLYLAVGKGVFEKMHTFTLSSRSGDGFAQGMPVHFSGFNIGSVSALELNDQGIVLIKIKIPDRHVKWIRSESSFILYRPLIGSSRIIVNTSNLKSLPLDKNKIPEVIIVNDINDAIAKIEPVLERVTEIAENVERLTFNLSDPEGDLSRVLGNAKKITANLASKKSLVEMAVSDEESVQALNDSLKKLKDITTNVDRILTKTDSELYGNDGILPQVNVILKDLVGKLKKLDKTVDNINNISTDVSEGVKDFHILRSDIDAVVNSLDNVVKKLDAIIGSKKTTDFKVP